MTALITGATGGLGQALAALLHSKNIPLILTGRDPHILAELAHKYNAITITLDLTHDLSPLIYLIHQHTPTLLINNAGYALYGDTLSHSTDSQLELLTLNATVPIRLTLEAAKALRAKNKSGTILNVSSLSGAYSFPGLNLYAASKSFLTTFSRTLDLETRPHIRVLAALPGQIDTPFATRAAKRPVSRTLTLDPHKVALAIYRQIQTGHPVQIIDWRYALLYKLSCLFPKSIVSYYLYREMKRRVGC